MKKEQRKIDERPSYLFNKKQKRKGELEKIGRFGMGCETRACKYWLKEEDKLCKLCKEEMETAKRDRNLQIYGKGIKGLERNNLGRREKPSHST